MKTSLRCRPEAAATAANVVTAAPAATAAVTAIVAITAALLALAIATPADAAVRYRAFGDSISRGNACFSVPNSGGDNSPAFIFDHVGSGCKENVACKNHTQADADNCGYSWRLEASLIAGGITDAEVVNDGSSGERTPEGLTRIDSVLSATDDVLLLMEGTNDISILIKGTAGAISVEAIKNNLAAMVDKATALGLDTMVSSTIRRVCPNFATSPSSCTSPPVAWPSESNTRDLRDETRTMADDKNRAMGCELQMDGTCNDVFNRIGRTQTLVNLQYVQDEPKIGHVDEDGYDEMDLLFEDAILRDAALGTPSVTAPAGGSLPSPAFQWDSAATATLYNLVVETAGGGPVSDEWYEASDVCAAGTCEVTLGAPLSPGNHSWRVRGRNLRGPSPWSAWTDFEVFDTAPGATNLTAPSGDCVACSAGGNESVNLQWDAATGALDYDVSIVGDGGTTIFKTLTAAAACGGTASCSTTESLPAEGYTWTVRATNPVGDGPWAPDTDFTICPVDPPPPTPIGPSGDIFTGTSNFPPTFRWTAAVLNVNYDLVVDNPPATVFTGASACVGAQCAGVGPSPAVGAHSWQIRSATTCGTGTAWSAWVDFTVLTCDPVNLALTGADTSSGSVFAACQDLNAGSGFSVLGAESVSFHAGERVILENDFSVLAGGELTIKVDG